MSDQDYKLTLDDISPAMLKISTSLPSPLDVLFDDIMGALDGGDQDIYACVGFGIGIIPTIAGDWTITDYDHAILAWHLRAYERTWPGATKAKLRISNAVLAILEISVTSPGYERQDAAENLQRKLTELATGTYEV